VAETQTLIQRVAEQARRDPDRVRPVLQALLGDQPETSKVLREIAIELNESRRKTSLEEFMAGSLTTEAVMQRLPSVTTRQGVHRLRERGKLMARTVGNASWFPTWQFGDHGLREDLDQILAAIRRYTGDAVAADRIMRLPRQELRGRTLSEALDSPRQRARAWQLLLAIGHGG
jgi:hypothetical protein